MFATWEISNLFEEGKLFELFFEHTETAGSGLVDMTKAPSVGR
jgi:hypothetical protein